MGEINRRTLLRGALGAAGVVAAARLAGETLDDAEPAGAATSKLPPVNLSPLMFHSPRVEPFVDELPQLPTLQGSDITVMAGSAAHRFHRDYEPSPSFGYNNSSYLGPVIEAHVEEPTRLRHVNRLENHPFGKDIDVTLMHSSKADATMPRTVLHLHGAVTAPSSDGHALATIRPGQEYRHLYPNRQEAAALWYHDHAVGITRLNVYAGLAAPFLLRDRFDTGTNANPLGLPAGDFEIPLVIQEKIFSGRGRQSVRSTPIVPQGSWEGGAVGDVGVVNGKAFPNLDVARGLYRFRLLNAASYSVMNLFFSNRMRFWVIGSDGGLLDAPAPTTVVRIAPAERVDVLVDFSSLQSGETVELRNDEKPPQQAYVLGERALGVYCRFRATATRGFTSPVPTVLRGGARGPAVLPSTQVRPDRVRNLTIGQYTELRLPPAIMSLNNLTFDSEDIELPVQGSVEQWNLINVTRDPHPIHIHLVNFRVLGRQRFNVTNYNRAHPRPTIGTKWNPSADPFVSGPMEPAPAYEQGWKDTVRTDGNTITRLLIRFPTADELGFDPDETFRAPVDPLGASARHPMQHEGMPMPKAMSDDIRGYMWHCHLLDHEDHDMMLNYRTVAR